MIKMTDLNNFNSIKLNVYDFINESLIKSTDFISSAIYSGINVAKNLSYIILYLFLKSMWLFLFFGTIYIIFKIPIYIYNNIMSKYNLRTRYI